jgi:hypothetical protein
MSETHIKLTATGAVHLAHVHPGQTIPTNRPTCGAGNRRSKGTVTAQPVTCAKCLAK